MYKCNPLFYGTGNLGFMRCFIFTLLATLLLFPINVDAYDEPDAAALLKRSDQARGGDLHGLAWEVYVVNTGFGSESQLPMRVRVKAMETASWIEVSEPPNSKGSKMLQVERNMWLTKPGLKKPVAISPRQRLTGQAAIGDIAATNYAKDYNAHYLRSDLVFDEQCDLLDLNANHRNVTYARILYWVSVQRGVAMKAEFYSLSGKLLKTAYFEYDNTISVKNKKILFVSRMIISDALTDARTTLTYDHVKVQAISPATFDVESLH
jgi:hypothetical protein